VLARLLFLPFALNLLGLLFKRSDPIRLLFLEAFEIEMLVVFAQQPFPWLLAIVGLAKFSRVQAR
jgi:hypothetical protein